MRLPYRLVRPLARIALKIYFKNIYISGLENLPQGKPIIFAANHPTAFLEPCLLACLLPTPLHFMVRGDFFQKPIFRKMLESLQMIPMYRKKDIGIKGVKNNFSSLDIVYDLLAENKAILILAEGTTEHEKRLRPIQKGTARMALGAIKKHPDLAVQIVPIGVNYADVLTFRSTVMLDIGPAIDVLSFLSKADGHPAKAIKQLTTEVKSHLEKQVVVIDKVADEVLTEQLLELQRSQNDVKNFPSASRVPLEQEIQIAQAVNQMAVIEKDELRKLVSSYFKELSDLELKDKAIISADKPSFIASIALVFGFIPYLLGRLLNFLPLQFGKWWAENKVAEIVFYAPLKVSLTLGAYIFYALLLLLLALIIGQTWFWLSLLTIPLLGYFSLFYYEYREDWKAQRLVAKTDTTIIDSLRNKRATIQKQLSVFFLSIDKK